MPKSPIGLQLYSVRELTARDFPGTLQMVANAGFGAVEFAGYGDIPAGAMRRLLRGLNLKPIGSHAGLESLQSDFNKEADYCNEIGGEFLIVPAPPEQYCTGMPGWQRLGEALRVIADKAETRGLRLCYHNHNMEFQRVDGRLPFEVILESAGGKVGAEIDTYWVQYAGENPAAAIESVAGKCPLVHLKDMAHDGKHDCEIGEGTLDWVSIHGACGRAGVEAYVVEQEDFSRPAEESLRITVRNLRRLGMA